MPSVRLRLAVTWVLIASATVACLRQTAIWVVEGSRIEHLTFAISDVQGNDRAIDPGFLVVHACDSIPATDEARMWSLVSSTAHPPRLHRIVYDEVPEGWRTVVPAKPLKVGCYNAVIEGTGSVKFVVEEDGTIRELKDPGGT